MNSCFTEIIDSINTIIDISGEKLEGNCFYPWGNKNNNNSIILESLSNKRKNYRKTVLNKKYVCEIGFNAGHSLICMILENPNAEYTLFDLGEHKYSRPCFEFCKQLFPNTKMEIFWGDSRETLVNYLENPLHKTFDVIHIGGGHTPEIFEKDWNYSYKLLNEKGIIIFDDTDLPDIKNFVHNQIKKGLVLDDSHNYEPTQILEHKILIKMNQAQNIKPKLLWVGDDYRIKSGYGRVARELFPYLYREYDIIQYSIGCQGLSNEYYVIDSNDGTAFGFNKLPNVINTIEPTIVILLNDSKIIHGWLSSININCKNIPLLIPYVCTEYIGVPENEVELYNTICSGLLAMANFTIDEFNNNGSRLKSMRLSHGYSDNIKKINKLEAKQKLNIPEDTFVFFSGSKNQPRKRLDIIIRAFVDLLTRHADKKILLMFNCGLIDIGWNLQELYIRLCKENKIANMGQYIYFCSNNINDSNKNDEELTFYYNACDVGITTSTGESFGLIPFEQSALGIPQIIPNWGGIIESICYGSIKVETNDYYVYPVVLQSSNGEARTVHYKDVSKAMETYLLDKELYELHSREVLKNVQHYNWENICFQLVHFLNEIVIYKNSIPIKEVKLRNDVSFKMTLYNDNDFISSLIYKYGIWEENNTNYILDLMKENQNTDAIIIDIGANIGYYSLLSAAMGYTCHSFEPDPSNFEKLNSSVKLNNFDNKIKLYNNALSNKANETIILSTVAGNIVNHGCLSVLKDFIPYSSNTVQCVTLRLDDVINKKDEILLIKIDVEGFEPEVIEGSLELLKSGNIQHILIEISPKFRKIEDYIKMICILAQNNFTKILNLDSRKILNYEELIKELPSLPKGQCDYLFFYEKDNTTPIRFDALKQIYKPHVDKLDIPIWCINLEKNTNRKQHIIDEFGKQNIHVEFINAVDGLKIDFRSPEYKSLFTDFGLNKIYSNVKEHGHDLTLGGAGLILTVKDVWNKITVPTLIFEDDVELCEHFDSQLSNITSKLPKDWDIVYIGYYHDPKIQQINEHIWTANKVYGLYGYLIHPNYAKKILTNTFPCNYQIDTEINRFNANSNCFVVYPPLVYPSNKFTTDIQICDIHPIKKE